MGKEAAAVMQAPEWEGFLAVAAKSLQSCPTLSDSMDCSLPGSSIHGIFQAGVLEWVAIAFSTFMYRVRICSNSTDLHVAVQHS